MECLTLRDQDPRWDAFVSKHPAATFFHLLVWREIIRRSFGYEPFYLFAEDGGRICGVLPLFLVKSWIFGKSLVAAPVEVYGGIVADNEDISRLLLDHATRLADEHKVRYLEVRGNPYGIEPTVNGNDGAVRWSRKDLYV